jgi:hypothetical protein
MFISSKIYDILHYFVWCIAVHALILRIRRHILFYYLFFKNARKGLMHGYQ